MWAYRSCCDHFKIALDGTEGTSLSRNGKLTDGNENSSLLS